MSQQTRKKISEFSPKLLARLERPIDVGDTMNPEPEDLVGYEYFKEDDVLVFTLKPWGVVLGLIHIHAEDISDVPETDYPRLFTRLGLSTLQEWIKQAPYLEGEVSLKVGGVDDNIGIPKENNKVKTKTTSKNLENKEGWIN